MNIDLVNERLLNEGIYLLKSKDCFTKVGSLKTLESYIKSEIKKWDYYKSQKNFNFTTHILNHLHVLLNEIMEIQKIDEDSVLGSHLSNLFLKLASPLFLSSNSYVANLLISRYQIEQNYINQAFSYLISNTNPIQLRNNRLDIKSIAYFNLILMGNGRIVDDNLLDGIYQDLHDKYSDVFASNKRYLDEQKEKISQQRDLITSLHTDQENEFKQILNEKINRVDEFFSQQKQKVEDLTHLYTEKLRLSAASKHWKSYQKSQRNLAFIWFGAALLLFLALSIFLSVLAFNLEKIIFTDTPEIVITGNEIPISQITTTLHLNRMIKWFLIVSVIVSMGIYLLRQFVKLGMSSMHLSRDAAERRQLSHQYLALLKNTNGMTDKEKEIILQALFSRSDTGLLKTDAGPTLPGQGIINVMKP